MITPEQRIEFCEKYLTTKGGRPFSVVGRDWVLEEFFRPADGWRLWPRNAACLCADCRARAGEIVQWTPELEDDLARHVAKGCDGLTAEPIMLTVINLPRREGKTLNTAGYLMSTIFCERFAFVTYVAAAGKQTKTLFEENFKIPIEANKRLLDRAVILGESIRVPSMNSKLEVVETSHASITGRGRTHVVIDEARDIDARVIAALLPSMRDQNGLVCPENPKHQRLDQAAGVVQCRVCGARMRPWYGRVIIESSSGLLDSDERAWFSELVEQQEQDPHPNVHLYRRDDTTNPSVAEKSTAMLQGVFGALPSMSTYMDVELQNVTRRKGEDFVSAAALKAVVRSTLTNSEGSDLRCVAFLDTSISKDLTSLVIVCEDEETESPWDRVFVARIDSWDPKLMKRGLIDPEVILAHFDRYVPLFPRLLELQVDVRLSPWSRDFVARCRGERPGWGKLVKGCHAQQKDRDIAWSLFEQRILSGKILLPDHPTLLAEIRGVRRVVRADNTVEIRDRSRKKRHADIADGVANCCLRIWQEQTRPRMGLAAANSGREIRSAGGARLLRSIYRPRTSVLKPGK